MYTSRAKLVYLGKMQTQGLNLDKSFPNEHKLANSALFGFFLHPLERNGRKMPTCIIVGHRSD